MPTLRERLALQVSALQAERARIVRQAERNITDVDARLAVLAAADRVITTEVEQAYVALLALGLVKEI
jgi:hypothetical protein